jgi:hypothetical protein
MVLAKGILKTELLGNKNILVKEIIISNNNILVLYYYLRIPRSENIVRVSLLIKVGSTEAIRDLYN